MGWFGFGCTSESLIDWSMLGSSIESLKSFSGFAFTSDTFACTISFKL